MRARAIRARHSNFVSKHSSNALARPRLAAARFVEKMKQKISPRLSISHYLGDPFVLEDFFNLFSLKFFGGSDRNL